MEGKATSSIQGSRRGPCKPEKTSIGTENERGIVYRGDNNNFRPPEPTGKKEPVVWQEKVNAMGSIATPEIRKSKLKGKRRKDETFRLGGEGGG